MLSHEGEIFKKIEQNQPLQQQYTHEEPMRSPKEQAKDGKERTNVL